MVIKYYYTLYKEKEILDYAEILKGKEVLVLFTNSGDGLEATAVKVALDLLGTNFVDVKIEKIIHRKKKK
jgi:hypothetical protein